ncbi:hypothetical protein MJH12_04545 [bacterium]|nr:hypothetical protein [bacterium]
MDEIEKPTQTETPSYNLLQLAKFIKNPIETLCQLKYGISKYNDSYLELHSNLYPDYYFDFFESYEVRKSYILDTVSNNQDLDKQHRYHEYLKNIGKGPDNFILHFLNEVKLNQLDGLSPQLQKLSHFNYCHISIGEDNVVENHNKSYSFDELKFEQYDCTLKGSLSLFSFDDISIHIIVPLYNNSNENSKIYPLLFVYALLLHPQCDFIHKNQEVHLHYVSQSGVEHKIYCLDEIDPNKVFGDLLSEFFDSESISIDLNLQAAIYGFMGKSKANHICLNEDYSASKLQSNYSKYVNSLDLSKINNLFIQDNVDNLLHRAKKRFSAFYKEKG